MAYAIFGLDGTYGDLCPVGSVGRNQHTGSSVITPRLFN